MSSQMNTRVRLVRCPKCRLVLPELADVLVYKCGGCGTILQAKKRKSDPTKNNGLDLVSQEKEISKVSQEASPPSEGDPSTKRKESNQEDVEDCNEEQPRLRNSPDKLLSPSGLSCDKNEDPLSKNADHIEGDEQSYTLDGKAEGYQNTSRDHQDKFSEKRKFSDKRPISDQLTCHESESPYIEAKEVVEGSAFEERKRLELYKDTGRPSLETKKNVESLALEATEQLELDKDKVNYTLDNCTVNNQNESVVAQMVMPDSTLERSNHKDEVSDGSGGHGDGIESKYHEQQSSGRGQNDFQGHSAEPVENVSYAKEVSSSTELARYEIENQSSVCTDLDQSPLNESTISDTSMSTDHEQLEQFHKEKPSGFGRASSVDTLENLPLEIYESELLASHRNLVNSPTNRRYYAYNGSASSCDGDDHLPDQFPHLPRRKFKEANPVGPNEFDLDDRHQVNNTLRSESKILQPAMNFSSTLPGKIHHAKEHSNWNRDEWLQSRKHGQASGSRMALNKDEHLTALPFISTGPNTGHNHGSPSSYRKNLVHNPSFYPPRMPLNSEPENTELLRMVYELEDRLRQTRITERMANRRFPLEAMRDEKKTPLYYDQFLAESEICTDLNYSRYPVRYSHGKGCAQQRKSSRVPFSGEAAHYRHLADCLCLHCSPQVWHCSAQLPLPSACCKKGHRVAYSSGNCCSALPSGSSSPQYNTSSEYSQWGHEPKPNDRRHKDNEMKKLHLREKYSKSRHLRPVAGGSPIIACYHCSELLQLPADFLLFKRRCHQLRCHACRKVLKFSLENQIHVVPFSAEASAPPPSEVDDSSDVINQQNLASMYHSNSCPHTEPISCSDDLGPSFCRSCSTERESLLPPIQPLGRTTFNRKMSSGSSFDHTQDRKMKSVSREPHKESKYSREAFESPRRSAKISKWGKASTEIEEVQPAPGSPLHRLMGYSSPSQVIHW